MEKKYTAALVGTGRIGFTLGFDRKREQPASHTFALKQNRRIKIVGGVDVDRERLEAWQKCNKGASVFDTVSGMFAAVQPDIVTVAVNEDAHLETALEVISHKPQLLILEKPVALNMEQADMIKKSSEENSVPVLVNHERRFAFDYNIAREYISKIGVVQRIRANLFSGLRVYDPAEESSGTYSLLHDGTHLVDIVLFMLEEIKSLSPENDGGKNYVRLTDPVYSGIYFDKEKKNTVRNFTANYATPFCPDVSISISGRSRFFGFELDIIGTEGRICIGNGFHKFYSRKESKLYTGFYSLEEDRSVCIPGKTGYFSNMIQNAVDFLDGKCPLKSDLQTGINALEILEDIKNGLKKKLRP